MRLLTSVIACMFFTACGLGDQAERSTNPQDVIGRTWQWAHTVTPVEKITVSAPGRYTIILTDKGRLQAQFDCNRGGGDYKITEGTLSFGPLISTRAACPQDSQDRPFMRDLQRVSSFFIENGMLYLELRAHSGTMRFQPEQR